MKKLLAILMAVIMICSLSISAFADDPAPTTAPVISVDENDTHSYEVYQIFVGDLYIDENGKETLSNIKWGVNGTGTTGEAVSETVLNALEAVATKSDAEKLAVINNYVDITTTKVATINKNNSYTALPGYYLIKDVYNDKGEFEPETDEDDNPLETETRFIVQIVNDVEVARKASKIPYDDKVIDDGTATGATDNAVKIGDYVPYKITAHVPEGISNYDYYYFVITDILSKGLTYVNDTDHPLIVKAVNGTTETTLEAGKDYTLLTGDDAKAFDDNAGYSFVIGLIDAKDHENENIIVTYSALVNEEVEVVEDPNTNTEHVIYSRNPNHNYGGDTTPDGIPDEIDEDVFGETPDTTVNSWSTTLTIHKVDENGEILTGAEFTLSGTAKTVRVVTETKFTEDIKGTWYKLNDGKYTEKVPTADRMEKAAAGAEKGYVAAEAGFTGETITVDEVVYRAYNKDNDTGKEVFVLVKGTADQYASTTIKYIKTVEDTEILEDTDTTDVKKMVDEKDGTATFEGIAVGDYKIEETVTPDGYNTIDPIGFSVTFDPATKTFASSNSSVILATDNGLEVTIVNQSGAELPETGGIGTTIFYVLGGILLVGAAVLLITKKRMTNE